ncbi:MAG: TIGR00730 family Rossman fold protein [Trichlorobacter sp.]|jgi:uncharacterized protein (TIGR00730 family)|nr:TIGR00730 family Rossman fold protein [Trichlorobacter sp.]
MKSICVYCGSNPGSKEIYQQTARALGEELARRGITVVYGGGNIGLMGIVADAAMAASGRVIGVIPQALMDKELGHGGITSLHVVASMHERKSMMAELSDGFIALPGGFGTMEELCEIATWTQLGFHKKPCGVLNVAGFYDNLLAFMDHAVKEQFLRSEHRKIILSSQSPAELIDLLSGFKLPKLHKWLDKNQH